MLKCFKDTFGVLCCLSKKNTNEDTKSAVEEPVVEDPKMAPELFYVVNVPDRPCPPGYRRDRTGPSYLKKNMYCMCKSTIISANIIQDEFLLVNTVIADCHDGDKIQCVEFLHLMPTQRKMHHHQDCSICFQRLDKPVRCIKGHQICRECHEKGNECLLCMEIHCVNQPFGCTVEGTMGEMKKHQDICFYRWIRCAYHLQCGRHEISLSEYAKHLNEVHRPYIKKIRLNEEDEIILKTDVHSFVRTGNILRIEGTNEYFVRRCLLDLHGDVLLICLHYIGQNEGARNYIYKVSINQGYNAKYTCTSHCLPYVENSNSCIKLPNCNVLKPSKIFLAKDYLREIHYSVTIKRI